jgi:subfamily B ATP-binding cassette protein MsbA
MTGRSLHVLVSLTRGYPWALPVIVTLSLTASLAEGLGIGLIIPLLDIVLGGTEQVESSGPLSGYLRGLASFVEGEHAGLILIGAIFALIALKTFIAVSEVVISSRVIARAIHDLRLALATQLFAVSYEYFAGLSQGRLVALLDSRTYRAGEALRALANMITSICAVLVFGVLLLLLSWQLTLVVAIMVLPVSLVVRFLGHTAYKHGALLTRAVSGLSERILELLVSMRTIRLFNQEVLEQERFAEASTELRRTWWRSSAIGESVSALVELLYVPVFLAVIGFAWYLQMGVSSVLVFVGLLYRLQGPLRRLDASRVALASQAAAVLDVQSLRDQTDKPYLPSGDIRPDGLRDSIEFAHVTFRYAGSDVPALDDVSLVLKAGTITALVGDSGSGKSTLTNLLARLYDPHAGSIRADGVDLAQFDLRSWRSLLAFSGQDADLLTGTVRFNIAYGVDAATEAEVESAARAAQAHEFITQLPNGYATEVGPRGTQLSGGQRQRIALARAILRRPALLVLDEATNAVDGVTEIAIQNAIEQLGDGTTVLVVAHRLNTVSRADQVIVMRAGRIVQQGTPQELRAVPGLFADLYAAQHLETG